MQDLLLSHSCLKMHFPEIFLDRCNRLSIFVHEEHRRSAPAERFNSKRTAARKKIENASANHRVPQTGKDCGFDAIHRRSHPAWRHSELNTAGTTGDYSHGDAA